MRRPKPFLWLTFILGLGLALTFAWVGVRPGPGFEVVGGWATDGTCSWSDANPPVNDNYTIELVDVFPEGGNAFMLAGENEIERPLIATAFMTTTVPRRSLVSRLFGADGDTLAELRDEWFVCPTGMRWPDPELLIWKPRTWYELASPLRANDRSRLFRDNYARESKMIHSDHFMRALRAASRGESLAVYSPLVAVVPGEEERRLFEIDPLYTSDAGAVFTDGEKYVAYLQTDGGFHNVDRFYVLFDQPALIEGKAQQLMQTSDIEGGYRGIMAVDLNDGENTWILRTGPSPVYTMAGDLNGDGLDELVVQFYCPENSVSGHGTTDAGTTYVLCVDQAGNMLWRKRFLGVHLGSTAAIADVTGDGALDVVIVCSSTQYMDMGHAAVLSGQGQTLAERSDLGGLYGITVADFDGDGIDEIVTGGPDGTVIMLDGRLDVVASWSDTVDYKRIPNWDSSLGVLPDVREAELQQLYERDVPLGSFDIDGDGELEIVCMWTAWAHRAFRSHNRQTYFVPRGDVVVLGSDLQEEARAIVRPGDFGIARPPSDAPASLKTQMLRADLDGDGSDEIMLSNGTRGMFVFRVTTDG
ncbi:MAG: hypothetical protein JXB46_00280 [Candidatus Eisenbacteria bacterium]|nr:hypothetical protein [Candidatus Eisenbacteria bacterium]